MGPKWEMQIEKRNKNLAKWKSAYKNIKNERVEVPGLLQNEEISMRTHSSDEVPKTKSKKLSQRVLKMPRT